MQGQRKQFDISDEKKHCKQIFEMSNTREKLFYYTSGSQRFLWIPPFAHFGTFHSSLMTQNSFLFLPYYTSLQEYFIFQDIVSHLPFTCHGVTYCSSS